MLASTAFDAAGFEFFMNLYFSIEDVICFKKEEERKGRRNGCRILAERVIENA